MRAFSLLLSFDCNAIWYRQYNTNITTYNNAYIYFRLSSLSYPLTHTLFYSFVGLLAQSCTRTHPNEVKRGKGENKKWRKKSDENPSFMANLFIWNWIKGPFLHSNDRWKCWDISEKCEPRFGNVLGISGDRENGVCVCTFVRSFARLLRGESENYCRRIFRLKICTSFTNEYGWQQNNMKSCCCFLFSFLRTHLFIHTLIEWNEVTVYRDFNLHFGSVLLVFTCAGDTELKRWKLLQTHQVHNDERLEEHPSTRLLTFFPFFFFFGKIPLRNTKTFRDHFILYLSFIMKCFGAVLMSTLSI